MIAFCGPLGCLNYMIGLILSTLAPNKRGHCRLLRGLWALYTYRVGHKSSQTFSKPDYLYRSEEGLIYLTYSLIALLSSHVYYQI